MGKAHMKFSKKRDAEVSAGIMQTDMIETFWEFAPTADCVLRKVEETFVETKRTPPISSSSYFYNVPPRTLRTLRNLCSNRKF